MVSVKKGSERILPNAAKGNECPAQDAPEFNASLGEQMRSQQISQSPPAELAGDVLEGGYAIAEFLFGSKKYRRRVYYLAESSRLPIFRLGSVLCARKSVLLEFISSQEGRVLLPDAWPNSARRPKKETRTNANTLSLEPPLE
jgi:hypothetical protein